jgi:tetratricopeptide (TPR) repeat protein
MVSSTYTDLAEHRAALIDAIHAHKMHANVMEHDSARLVDVIDSSLQMVRDSEAYILIVSQKYGQTPECATRNPRKLSITELEFDEAQRLGRPTLLFIMGDDHPMKKSDMEKDPEKEAKLNAFRERAKKVSPGSSVHRVYAVFNSLQEFRDKMNSPLAELEQHLNSSVGGNVMPGTPLPQESADVNPIPLAPAFYARPDYIGGHDFIGRAAQLKILSDWAKADDPNSVLLFEAIGGNGKSMLTWEWANNHAPGIRQWAGRFWFSFYEKGAIMRDFCQHALAYMTGKPLKEFEKRQTAEMKDELLAQFHARPWLLILDGLERVLVAYHRIDAAELRDEEVDIPTDKVLNRNPCDAIRDEDNDLLRAMAGARPSRILISSRLIPRVLLNQAALPLPGVRPVPLPGLDEVDAEQLLRSCGITGSFPAIRYYLTTYCANHPLVIGVLAGLINAPGPHRGDFDGWSADPEGGAKLDLASLNLVQRRNHILRAALDALPPPARQLLSTLALLSDAVDYRTVAAFNPHLPPEPDEVEEPTPPQQQWDLEESTDEEKAKLRQQYEAALAQRKAYEQAMQAWLEAAAVREAPRKLTETVQDLERRGLLQYDGRTSRYDLHPVVRGVAVGVMKAEDKECYGQRVVDHFSSQPHDPYEQARTLEEVSPGLNLVRTLLKLGHHKEAKDACWGDLSNALLFNLEAYVEILSLLRPFFPTGWGELPKEVDNSDPSFLANIAAGALRCCGELREALGAYGAAIRSNLDTGDWQNTNIQLRNIGSNLSDQNLLAKSFRVDILALDLAIVRDADEHIFISRLSLFADQSALGQWRAAEATWQLLDPMGRDWDRGAYRQGDAELNFAEFQFLRGAIQEEHLTVAARLAEQDHNRSTLRDVHRLRGTWRLEQGEWAQAAASFQEAVRMARERRLVDEVAETGLALAKHHRGQLAEPRSEAERLAQLRDPAHRTLALLWLALGDHDQAKQHALAAYRWASADGEPYVHRYELTRTTELLQQMNVPAPVPTLPAYDPAKDEPFPWEAEVRAVIEKLRAEKEAKKKGEGAEG